jgi:flagellar capping protein FliD
LNAGLSAVQAEQGRKGNSTAASGVESSFALTLANFRAQSLGALISSISGTGNARSFTGIDALASFQDAAANPLSSLANISSADALSAVGRNPSLSDPESAYAMMSLINKADVAYKAQVSALGEMKTYVAGLQQHASSLGSIDTATDNGRIKSQLQDFASQYNGWVQRFDADMRSGGVLAGTRAAQVSRYELDQSIKNIFHGASDGLQGLRDLGFSIDPATGLATLDTARLDSVLTSNRLGAIHALQQFGANFAKSAELLGSAGNFIARQLDNLGRAIHYIDDNKPALQAEFGLGDPARPAGQVAQALAAYNQNYT